MSILDSLKWRAAIKKFNPAKKVEEQDIEKLLEAANLTATSGGLQPFKMVVISNDDIKSKLIPMSYGQEQVGKASHVLVFAIETDIDESIVDAYVERAAAVRDKSMEELIGYSNSMKSYISSMDETAKEVWAKNQAYIALGTVLTVAADLKIDACPMEGIIAEQYQELLGLKSQNLMPVLSLPVGYRSEEDVHSKEAKIRKTKENFIITLN